MCLDHNVFITLQMFKPSRFYNSTDAQTITFYNRTDVQTITFYNPTDVQTITFL